MGLSRKPKSGRPDRIIPPNAQRCRADWSDGFFGLKIEYHHDRESRSDSKENPLNVIGLDIAKLTVECRLDGRRVQSGFSMENNIAGCLKAHQWIKANGIRKAVVCMEATGIYYRTAADYFSRYYDVYVVNPLKIKEYAKAQFVRTKTDKADAALIADYAKRHLDRLHKYETPAAEHRELQDLNVLAEQIHTQITRHKNRLYVSTDPYIGAIHQDLINVLQEKLAHIDERREKLIARSAYGRQYGLLQTVAGISGKTAAVLLQHLSAREFKTANRFVAFAGLSPQTVQSGSSVKGAGRLSRYGHRRLKKALFMPALSFYRSGAFKPFTDRLEKAGKPKMVIIGALMRKLAKIAYYVYKSGQPFDAARHKAA